MRSIRLFSVLTLVSASVLTSALMAQDSAVTPRVTSAVSESSLVALKGNVPGMARAEFDRGQAPAATQLTHIRLVLARSAEQQAALDQYDAELQDKSSPNYHKWLTPEQFGRLYGPADSDIAAILAWLQSHGLTPEPVSPGRTNIAFSGTVQQVEEALHTSIHTYEANGQQFFSNTANPSIPAALATVVAGVAHLNTIEPRPHHVGGKFGMFDPEAGRLVPSVAVSGPAVNLAPGSGSFLYIVAADAATMYDSPNSVLNPNYTGTGYSGAGITIGVGGDAAIQAGTVVNYRGKFIGDAKQLTITNLDNVGANGDTDEAYIDVELAGALAPGAAIHFYTASSLGAAIDKMIADNTVDIFSLSFGYCELMLTTADNLQINSWWQNAETQGIAVTVSTGDSGSAGCDNGVTAASYGLQVSGWSSTTHNIAVGGTDTDGLISYYSTYASSTNGSLYRTARSYIPESTWNDSVQNDGLLSANLAYHDKTTGNTNVVAATGGASSCSTNGTTVAGNHLVLGACTSGYAKPAWQRGTGVPVDSVRDVPDVSLMAGNGMDYAAWAICTDDQSKNLNNVTITANCATQSDGYWYLNGFGGTSTAAPAFAGILALVQQKAGARLGQAAKEIYDLYNGSHASAIFHDVTTGNISVPCVTATPDCGTRLFLAGYDTTAGYDLATGIGSVDIAQLVSYWGTATGSGATTMTATPSLATLTTAQSLTVAVSVAGALGTATGTVTLSGGGYTSAAQTLDATGNSTFTIAAGLLARGSDTLTVTYSGDTSYATSSQTASVIVTGLAATITLTPPTQTVSADQGATLTAAVTGTAATPTGKVTISGGGYTSPAQTLSSGSFAFIIPAFSLAKGTDTLTASYSGDSTYAAGAQTASINVNGLAATLTVAPQVPTMNAGTALTVSGVVSGGTTTPTGTVTLTSGGYTSAPQTLSNGAYSITVPANSLSVGTDTLTVTYNGDTLYDAASNTATVLVTSALPATIAVTPATQTVTVTQSVSLTALVTSTSGIPTGTVTVSGGGYTSTAQTLSSGSFTFGIPAGSLAKGTDTLIVTYSGDTTYGAATGSASVIVTVPVYALAASATTPVNAGATATSTITVNTTTGYAGVITLTCALATQPTGATKLPLCSPASSGPVTLNANTTSASGTVNISTTAQVTASLKRPGFGGWTGAGGGAVLAFALFLWIPKRRRNLLTMLSMLVVMTALGSMAACGGGGSAGGGGTTTTPGTTAGTYTFTVTGTGNPAVTPAPTATVTLVVN